MSMLTGRPHPVTLTTTAQAEVQAAPGAGRAIQVLHIEVDNANSVVSTVSVKEGSTTKYNLVVGPAGGGAPVELPPGGWILPEDTALNVQQDVNSGPCYVTILTRVVAAQDLPD